MEFETWDNIDFSLDGGLFLDYPKRVKSGRIKSEGNKASGVSPNVKKEKKFYRKLYDYSSFKRC